LLAYDLFVMAGMTVADHMGGVPNFPATFIPRCQNTSELTNAYWDDILGPETQNTKLETQNTKLVNQGVIFSGAGGRLPQSQRTGTGIRLEGAVVVGAI
jgi:hypothetical protein